MSTSNADPNTPIHHLLYTLFRRSTCLALIHEPERLVIGSLFSHDIWLSLCRSIFQLYPHWQHGRGTTPWKPSFWSFAGLYFSQSHTDNLTKSFVADLWRYPSTRSFPNPPRAPPSKGHTFIRYKWCIMKKRLVTFFLF